MDLRFTPPLPPPKQSVSVVVSHRNHSERSLLRNRLCERGMDRMEITRHPKRPEHSGAAAVV